jgi:endonuclease/exonuclease/phosphatase family metal-dependent hydrolase
MKIATYNVWDENKGIGKRFKQLIHEINSVDADIIGLQEVTPFFYNSILLKETNYKHCIYGKYREEEQGLAVLSKYPIINHFFLNESEEYSYSKALIIFFELDGIQFSFANVHLPWDSVKEQETQIIEIDRYLHEQNVKVSFSILLGDFNNNINSSVDRFLTGEQTLNGYESNPYWNELSSTFAVLHDLPLMATLDVVNNPRWKGKNTKYKPSVMDRIYVMENWFDTSVVSVKIFGTDISTENNLSASDHYGVVAEVNFHK